MKSSFSKIFFPVLLILLIALITVGFSFQVLTKSIMKQQSMSRLENTADAIVELADSYGFGGGLFFDNFVVNLSVAARASGADAVICNAQGRLLMCSDSPLGCTHQGMVISEDYLARVIEQGVVRSTGLLQGLYTDARDVVAKAVTDSFGRPMGIVIVSAPMTGTEAVLEKIAQMYIVIATLVILAAVFLVSWLLRRQNAPLKEMAKAARDFGHGNLDARVRVEPSHSEEMQELSLAFNNMASFLQKSEYRRREFVANVSHELKTPMTTISGFVDGILDGTIPPQRQNHYLQMVSDETKRLNRLVRSMLDISRLQEEGGIPEEKKTRFDMAEAAGQTLITFEQRILEKGRQVQVDMPEHPVFTRADQDSITQVIYNLLDNAVKFCTEGGQLGIRLSAGGAKLYFSISNTGETIPPEELPLMFDRFHKLDKSRSRSAEGWGLGLYIVQTIIGSHGENISVTSQNGVTEFTFTLPLVN